MTPALPDATRIGAVALNVKDLDGVAAFYRDALGLRFHPSPDGEARLGRDEVFLRLVAAPGAPPRVPRAAGLFHVAYLMPTRVDLAQWLRHAIDARIPIQGAGDHGVSEAIYLADPEGNGIEVYADRPREAWPRRGGSIPMGTAPVDIEDLLAEAEGSWTHAPDGLRVGHVHLQVTDVDTAARFYREVVGFDETLALPGSASFLSAGGYHHHVAVNTWATARGPPADPAALGLRSFTIDVPKDGLQAVRGRLGGDEARDPSGNRVVLRAA